MKKVTGIGGIFFKCEDAVKMKEWYSEHLGLVTNEYGSMFESRNIERPEEINHLQWNTFSKDSKYFDPSDKAFMINYRVHDLEALLLELKKQKVEISDEIQSFEYGKFLHILDPEGNKIELWEAVDSTLSREKKGKEDS